MFSFEEDRPSKVCSDRSLDRSLLERNRWEDGDYIMRLPWEQGALTTLAVPRNSISFDH